MKTNLKKLFAAALLATTASVAFADSYEINSVDGSVKLTVSLQGAGTAKIPGGGVTFPPGGFVKQRLLLNEDHTMTGFIYYGSETTSSNLFTLTGSWYRPEGSKVIYYALDGDPTQGAASGGTWGALFDPAKATLATLQDFMPLLFGTKVSSLTPIYPAIGLKTGIIKLNLANDQIKGATTNMTITGRAMTSYCKMDKAETPACTIPNGIKDASFSFSSITKSTITTPIPAP